MRNQVRFISVNQLTTLSMRKVRRLFLHHPSIHCLKSAANRSFAQIGGNHNQFVAKFCKRHFSGSTSQSAQVIKSIKCVGREHHLFVFNSASILDTSVLNRPRNQVISNKALNTFPSVTGTVTQRHFVILPLRHCPLA